ncbi:MAG: hypothetical protein IJD89_01155 [Clostridia bacterium]|nr:hypothetical protein [Clostridia bacterium]
MKERNCYELSPSQDVSYLQCKYTLFKRVINIVTSITIDEDVDFELMEKAFNIVVERNDCLRIRFFKEKGKLMQYFEDEVPYQKVSVVKYDTKEQFDSFISKYTKRAIAYLKGKIIEPHFIKTHDGKSMVLFKVCHLVLDVYGVNVIFMDLLAVYNALKNGTELPAPRASFEEVVKKDIEKHNNMRLETKHAEFFKDLLNDKPEPYYNGIHGPDNKIWQKKLKQNHRGMRMFFIQNDTRAYRHSIGAELTTRVLDYCKENQVSPANFLFYTCSLTAAILNGKTRNALPLGLYNCRISQNEKNCAGSKVQSIACYSRYNYKKTFEENIKRFSASQSKLYMHVGFSDREFEMMLHKAYRSSLLETYYSIAFSFVPIEVPDGIYFDIYSNGKGALPAYIIQLFDTKTNEITMAYDVHTKTTSEEAVAKFHEMYKKVIEQVLNDPQIQLRDIELQ